MSELGALLELIHDAHSRLTTFEGEYRDWMMPRPSLELYVERSELGAMQAQWRGGGPFPKAVGSTRRIWLTAPNCLRLEVTRNAQLVSLAVLCGERWWQWDHDRGAVCGDSSPDRVGWVPPPPLFRPRLVTPATMLAALRFRPVGTAVRAGRKVMMAQATPRFPAPTGRSIRYELDFDTEHGTILHRAVLDGDAVVSVTDAVAVAYGRPVDSSRFVFASPDGQTARHVRPQPVDRQLASG